MRVIPETANRPDWPRLVAQTVNALVRQSGTGGSAVAWEDVTGKPTEFPPEAHTHIIDNVTGLQTALDAKQATLVSGTNLKSVNGASLLGSGDLTVTGSDPWTYAKLSSAVTNSSTTATNITGLAFTPDANTQYEFEAMLLIQAAVATTGVRPGVTWPTGLSDGIAFVQSATSATAFTFALGNNAAAVQANAANIPGADQSYPARVIGTLIAGATPSGALQLTVASEVGSSEVRIMPGSFLKWRVI